MKTENFEQSGLINGKEFNNTKLIMFDEYSELIYYYNDQIVGILTHTAKSIKK